MPRYVVNVSMTQMKAIKVLAANEIEAEEKAVDVVLKWPGVTDAEAVDAEEIDE